MSSSIVVVEVYNLYTPPRYVRPAVERLLSSVPKQFLSGLVSVVLTDVSALSRARRRSRFKTRTGTLPTTEATGLYHRKVRGNGAWIELFVDRIVHGQSSSDDSEDAGADYIVGIVLYHEIGHHIHRSKAPEYRDKEDVADRWRRRLLEQHMDSRYPGSLAIIEAILTKHAHESKRT